MRSDLAMGSHLDEVITAVLSSIDALHVLSSHGPPALALHVIAMVTATVQLMYGYASSKEKGKSSA